MTKQVKKQVFVYGTLKEGRGNYFNYLNGEGAQLLGPCLLEGPWKFVDLGHFPGIVRLKGGKDAKKQKVFGQVFSVTDEILLSLDFLEGYNKTNPADGFYDRDVVSTPYGDAYAYFLPEDYATKQEVEGGVVWSPTEEELKWIEENDVESA